MTAIQTIKLLCACIAVLGFVLGRFHTANDKLEAENRELKQTLEEQQKKKDSADAPSFASVLAPPSTLAYRPCRWAWEYCDGNCEDCVRRQYTISDRTAGTNNGQV